MRNFKKFCLGLGMITSIMSFGKLHAAEEYEAPGVFFAERLYNKDIDVKVSFKRKKSNFDLFKVFTGTIPAALDASTREQIKRLIVLGHNKLVADCSEGCGSSNFRDVTSQLPLDSKVNVGLFFDRIYAEMLSGKRSKAFAAIADSSEVDEGDRLSSLEERVSKLEAKVFGANLIQDVD